LSRSREIAARGLGVDIKWKLKIKDKRKKINV
jgi:hypothetical protein